MKKFALYKFNLDSVAYQQKPYEEFPFKYGQVVVMLGEIEQMPGHCIVATGGKVYFGYHTDDFTKLIADEC